MSTAMRRLFEEVSPEHPPDMPAAIALPRAADAVRALPPAVAAPPAAGSPLAAWLRAHGAVYLMSAASLLGVLLFWHLATTYRWDFYIRFTNIPTPLEVLEKVVQVNQNGKFITNIGMSLRRIFIGFAAATVVGVAMGLAIGRYRFARHLLFPALEALRPIPAIAWVPISIMLWPDNEVSIVFITFIGAFFPILLNTVSGVQSVDAVLLRAGQCLGAKERQLMRHVVLPGAAPQIFTGLAVGMGVAWVSLIAAEMISGQFGIGYFTWEAYSLISYAEIVLGMITIGLLGLVCSGLIRLAGKTLMPWLDYAAPQGSAR
ncbi:ABC transporter permease [Piscinibacter sp. XHJ-5]|uniref:ABC transporter permease n=1 Tax=Piscinibacter sp. XHJ-5 TaxID=3037797 RepID=UPI0024534D50|nr:ABC transporter permease [Piscinibacter sp. XHJ-5]